MGDLAPPDVAEAGLHLALADLVDATEAKGIRVSLDLPNDLALERDIAQVVYRVVREGLRNVVKHARARTAVVGVHGEGERVEVRVSDDGQGGAAAARETTHRLPGHHLGLGLLADTLTEVGGELRVEDRPGGGTVLAVSLPRELAT
jgi:signal transduction histidine kinase